MENIRRAGRVRPSDKSRYQWFGVRGLEEGSLETVSDSVKFVGNLVRETAHGDDGSKGNQGSNQGILDEVLTGLLIQKGPQQSLHVILFLPGGLCDFVLSSPDCEAWYDCSLIEPWITCGSNDSPVELRQGARAKG